MWSTPLSTASILQQELVSLHSTEPLLRRRQHEEASRLSLPPWWTGAAGEKSHQRRQFPNLGEWDKVGLRPGHPVRSGNILETPVDNRTPQSSSPLGSMKVNEYPTHRLQGQQARSQFFQGALVCSASLGDDCPGLWWLFPTESFLSYSGDIPRPLRPNTG